MVLNKEEVTQALIEYLGRRGVEVKPAQVHIGFMATLRGHEPEVTVSAVTLRETPYR